MQKHILLFIISLTLFSGCDRKEKESASLTQILGIAASPQAAQAQSQTNIPRSLAQPRESNSQSVSDAVPDPGILAIGEKVNKGTCGICHKTGLNGAPRTGDKKDWGQRAAQGNEVLYSRAINGYRGSKGFMPPRGSNPTLSETEVKAAVDYIIEHSTPSRSALSIGGD